MSAINDLLEKVDNEELRNLLQIEFAKLQKKKKFGLVFEEHLPESTLLYGKPISVNCNVTLRDDQSKRILTVKKIYKTEPKEALCEYIDSHEDIKLPLNDLICVAQFGESIYPYLKPQAAILNDKNSDLWHTLIEADNYHALQLLEYLYAGKVDCIYIDPPYNTGAKDWKYNNNYVDSSDSYRHSKWLSFMKKRLELSRKLLNPKDSVLIVTIDENEYHHLACLLEQTFPDARIDMISTLISRKGTARTNRFTRNNEYIFFVMLGNISILPLDTAEYAKEGEKIHWQTFRRSSIKNIRSSRPNQFYPIYVNVSTKKIVKIGNCITPDTDISTVPNIGGCVPVFPIRDDGTEMLWGVTDVECRQRAIKGYLRATQYTPTKPQKFIIQYLMEGTISDIDNGKIEITGYDSDGSVIGVNRDTKKILPRTLWNYPTHDARDYGSKIIKELFANEVRFEFPKSLYAVHDALRFFVKNKPNALILDFFAGSGTTLHAVNLLNAEDGGKRRCIMVTNNEVSEAEANSMRSKGLKPGDEEWEKFGIAKYVTWPRTVQSILGKDINGKKLSGNYYGSDIPMSDGFKSNAIFFKLEFLDKNEVELGRKFTELLPILWMKAGAVGTCPKPKFDNNNIPPITILSGKGNNFAILVDENYFTEFAEEVNKDSKIEVAYIVTDSDAGYREMATSLNVKETYQLYRDYLDNFRINRKR